MRCRVTGSALLSLFLLFLLFHALICTSSNINNKHYRDRLKKYHSDEEWKDTPVTPFQYVNRPIKLVEPDETNTKIILKEEGLAFLESLKGDVVLVSCGGKTKTGKSYLLNQLLGLYQVTDLKQCDEHRCGFPVGTTTASQTRGIDIWGKPLSIKRGGQAHTVVFLDAEGLGAIGNPGTYDSKVLTLSVIINSVLLYNMKEELLTHDISSLHEVSVLANIFESKLNQKFPFPIMFWLIQNFEHDLRGKDPEKYLAEVLQEKPNPTNSQEIQYYNETVRVVKQFPDKGSPHIFLFDSPYKGAHKTDLPRMTNSELAITYLDRVSYLKNIIFQKMEPKQFNGFKVTGRFLADLIRDLVVEMNEMETADIGITLVKNLALELNRRCFENYSEKMKEIALPDEPNYLETMHQNIKKNSLEMFTSHCIGGLDAYGNRANYENLEKSIDLHFENLQKENRMISHQFCMVVIDRLFTPLEGDSIPSLEEFDLLVQDFIVQYNIQAKGPKDIKENILKMKQEGFVKLKRDIVAKESAREDFKQICIALVSISFLSFIISKVCDIAGTMLVVNKLFSVVYSTCILVLLVVIGLFFNIAPEIISLSFETVQFLFSTTRSNITRLRYLAVELFDLIPMKSYLFTFALAVALTSVLWKLFSPALQSKSAKQLDQEKLNLLKQEMEKLIAGNQKLSERLVQQRYF